MISWAYDYLMTYNLLYQRLDQVAAMAPAAFNSPAVTGWFFLL